LAAVLSNGPKFKKLTTAKKIVSKFYNGQVWTSKIPKHLWQTFRTLWLLRNANLHGITFSEGKPVKCAPIHPLIEHIYDHNYELNPHDRKMLSMPLNERLALPLSTLIIWLSTIQPAFEEAHICNKPYFDLKDALALASRN
jgi:hypothetical protein